jgi:ubiquinone biosynthesis protein UbiJ
MSVDSQMLALKAMFDPALARDMDVRLELRLGEDRFQVEVAAGRIELGRGGTARPDAVVETDQGTLAALVWGGRELAEAAGAGDLTIAGDAAAVERFLGLFPMPVPAA